MRLLFLETAEEPAPKLFPTGWARTTWEKSSLPNHPAANGLYVYCRCDARDPRRWYCCATHQAAPGILGRPAALPAAAAAAASDRDTVVASASTSLSTVPALPTELVSLIVESLLEDTAPAGRIFLIRSLEGIYSPRRATPGSTIEQYAPQAPVVDITRYALVCRAWRDLCYAHFYGSRRNSFHLTISCPQPDRMRQPWWSSDRLIGTDPATHDMAQLAEDSAVWRENQLGPLAKGTASWIARATINVQAARSQSTRENDALLMGVELAVARFGGEATRLKELSVQLCYLQAAREMTTMTVKFCPAEAEDGIYCPAGSAQTQQPGPGQGGVDADSTRGGPDTLQFSTAGCCDAPKHSTTARVLRPLLRLRGLQIFSVGGLLTREFADELTAAVTQPSPSAMKGQ
ncbi:hypothetical protein Micbo1qcDRAFT_220069 [Microdochium bolleyi]|uniref:Uncharacterized protein n=1 Tax=Microdochium bolleyi TaxID=196109 RepID=A0A136ILZ5_9PEZI|nr:hypothetical protein Micbo1qcDRAFT_220069 [Microdochium bolleyi]